MGFPLIAAIAVGPQKARLVVSFSTGRSEDR
jgi:hypothetical protein